ncbi:MAG: SAM-dependent methyltransferase [Gammaproteobacteria bacterium]|nr:SAM-dependent methyltransferase [Gammaproteobacteria bacterium]
MTAARTDLSELLQTLNSQALLLRVLVSLAEHGIFDRLATGARTARELADGARLDEQALYRLLRFGASRGLMREDDAGAFHLAPGAEALSAASPTSVRSRLRRPWQDLIWKSYERLPDMLRTGETAFDLAFGESFFDYLAAHRDLNTLFDDSMAQLSRMENPLVAAGFRFADFPWIVDVGGGLGGLLAAILETHPGVHGVLFEQPQVIAGVAEHFGSKLEGRWEAMEGDFFTAVPPGGDLYLLKRILHDWDDARARQILENCRSALSPRARLLVIDALMQAGNEPDPNKFMDVNIMALNGGRERTAAEFAALFGETGLRLVSIKPLPQPVTLSLIEVALA